MNFLKLPKNRLVPYQKVSKILESIRIEEDLAIGRLELDCSRDKILSIFFGKCYYYSPTVQIGYST